MQNAEKISITVTPEMLRLMRDAVEAGEFASTSEVVRDAVRIWQRDRQEQAERLKAIRARVSRAFDDPRADLSEDEAKAELEAIFATVDQDLDRATP